MKPFYLVENSSKLEIQPDVFTSVSDTQVIKEDKSGNSKFIRYMLSPLSLYSIYYLGENDTITVGGFLDINKGEL